MDPAKKPALPEDQRADAASYPEFVTHSLQTDGPLQVTAGKDITSDFLSSQEAMVIDAGRSVEVKAVTAVSNVWAAARTGRFSGDLNSSEGWVYVWSFTDFTGRIVAKKTAVITAWNDWSGKTSADGGVEGFAGRNLTGQVWGKNWVDVELRGDLLAEVVAGDHETFADLNIRCGAHVTGPVTSSGNVHVAAEGNVVTNVTAREGVLNIVANGDIRGTFRSGEDAHLWSGGVCEGSVVAGLNANLRTGESIHASIMAQDGEVNLHCGGDVDGSLEATRNISIEATGSVSGSIKAGGTVSILANGAITASIEAAATKLRSAIDAITSSITLRESHNS